MTLISDTEIGHWGDGDPAINIPRAAPCPVDQFSSLNLKLLLLATIPIKIITELAGLGRIDRDGEQTQIAAESDIYLLGTHSFNDISQYTIY